MNASHPQESQDKSERLHRMVSFTIGWLVLAVIVPSFIMGVLDRHVRWLEYAAGFVGTFFVGGCMLNLLVMIRKEPRLARVVVAGVTAMVVSMSFGMVRTTSILGGMAPAWEKHLLRQFEVALNGLAFIAFMYAFFHAVIVLLDTRQRLLGQQTDLSREAERRKRSEEEYQAVVRTAMDGFLMLDAGGRIIDANDAYCQSSGYSREELLAMRIQDVDASEDVLARFRAANDNGGGRLETRHRCKDGTVIDIEASTKRAAVDGGRQYVFLRDITGNKRA